MMVQRIYKFLVVMVFMAFCCPASAQLRPLSVVPAPVVFVKYKTLKTFTGADSGPFIQNTAIFTPGLLLHSLAQPALEPDYYTQHFGFFCKKELQFEKATSIPLRFRLGDLQYVNKLEGK